MLTDARNRVESSIRPGDWRILLGLAVLAFVLRVAYGLFRGEEAFLTQGYTFYHQIAATLIDGDGFCMGAGVDCAVRMPLYPLLVAAFLELDWLFPGLSFLQAALSACRCLIAWGIGRRLFDRRTGLIAAALAAVNPYSVVHSTALQETAVFNLLLTLSVLLLLQSRQPGRSGRFSLAAGFTLGLTMLTSVRLVLFLPLAVLWSALPERRSKVWRLRDALLVSMPILLMASGWVARNWSITGTPVLTTEAGVSLWVANHQATFEFYPARSIDEVIGAAYDSLSRERQQILSTVTTEIEHDRLLGRWGFEYMWTNPGQTLLNMVRKVAWAFSGQLSPARDGPVQLVYGLSFAPLNAIALFGLWRSRGKPGGHLLVFFVFAAFAITTAVFWAHTSHKSALHLLICVYAASVIADSSLLTRLRRAHASSVDAVTRLLTRSGKIWSVLWQGC